MPVGVLVSIETLEEWWKGDRASRLDSPCGGCRELGEDHVFRCDDGAGSRAGGTISCCCVGKGLCEGSDVEGRELGEGLLDHGVLVWGQDLGEDGDAVEGLA